MLTRLISLLSEELVQEDEDGRDDTEEAAKTQHNKVTDTFRQWRGSSKVRVGSSVLLKGWDLDGVSHVRSYFRYSVKEKKRKYER